MFANRFTALIDACSLVGVLKRNLLLSLAEAGLYRARWSPDILDECQRALVEMFTERGDQDAASKALKARRSMEEAFPEASVIDYANLIGSIEGMPDPNDRHVLAAAVKIRASVIVTENLKDFPARVLAPLDLEAKSADDFIADTIDLDTGKAVAAVHQMRRRFSRPEITADVLLVKMEAQGLVLSVEMLREHIASL